MVKPTVKQAKASQAGKGQATEPSNAVSTDQGTRGRISQTDIPSMSLEEALRVPKAIFDQYAGAGVTPLQLGAALNLSPTSGQFRALTGASVAFGLTEGGYAVEKIQITELASRILKPLEEGSEGVAMVEALLRPRVVGEFLRRYNGSALPREEIGRNVLETLGVPPARSKDVFQAITEGARRCNALVTVKDKLYVQLEGASAYTGGFAVIGSGEPVNSPTDRSNNVDTNVDVIAVNVPAIAQSDNRRIFVTHGKNKSLIDPIKKLLAFGELEPVVAIESASISQPLPDKVMNEMRGCSGAIIHVEAERELIDGEGNIHRVLNENVLIEIGAAMALYGRRFILLKKDGVQLPSNLQGLFEVRYESDDLGANKTIELLDAINKLKKEPIPR